jgi:hypothetical protein
MALRASWNVSGWSETGLAFGTKPASTASGTGRRDQRGVYWPFHCAEAAASSLREGFAVRGPIVLGSAVESWLELLGLVR